MGFAVLQDSNAGGTLEGYSSCAILLCAQRWRFRIRRHIGGGGGPCGNGVGRSGALAATMPITSQRRRRQRIACDTTLSELPPTGCEIFPIRLRYFTGVTAALQMTNRGHRYLFNRRELGIQPTTVATPGDPQQCGLRAERFHTFWLAYAGTPVATASTYDNLF